MTTAAVSAGAVWLASRWRTWARQVAEAASGSPPWSRADGNGATKMPDGRGPGASPIGGFGRPPAPRRGGPAREAAAEDDDVRPAGHLLGQLHGPFRGLRAGVGEEERVDRVGAH